MTSPAIRDTYAPCAFDMEEKQGKKSAPSQLETSIYMIVGDLTPIPGSSHHVLD